MMWAIAVLAGAEALVIVWLVVRGWRRRVRQRRQRMWDERYIEALKHWESPVRRKLPDAAAWAQRGPPEEWRGAVLTTDQTAQSPRAGVED